VTTLRRVAGKRGRLPAKPRALGYLSTYLKSPLPAPVYPVDVSAGITNWEMLGNGPDPTCTTYPDGVGDCTFAGRQHYRMAKAAAAHLNETWETSNELVAEYLAYDHGQDDGAEISALLLSWFDAGKILAFAPVDHTNPAEVDSAMAAFHGCYVGVSLTDDADELFSEGRAWGTGSTTPDPDDGHCILKVRSDGRAVDTWVTWGALQESTLLWTRRCLDESWAVLTTEDEARLVEMPALLADINALHGTEHA
jgi:hypothetical protein